MTNLLKQHDIDNYQFFEGQYNNISHLQIWNHLLLNKDHDVYVILNDNVELASDFKNKLDNYIKNIPEDTFVLLFGSNTGGIRKNFKHIDTLKTLFKYCSSYTIHPVITDFYIGGSFGYLITKSGAKHLINYVLSNNIKRPIDEIILDNHQYVYETYPHIIFSNCIENDLNDYLFFPNKDSDGNDITRLNTDIIDIKSRSNVLPECVAFNSSGWLKHSLSESDNFIDLNSKSDGLYVKKEYLSIHQKLKRLRSKKQPLKVLIDLNAIRYFSTLIENILKEFEDYQLIMDESESKYDILINYSMEKIVLHQIHSINILLFNKLSNKSDYDLIIDDNHHSNVLSIYYPLILDDDFQDDSLIKSKKYLTNKTKFSTILHHNHHEQQNRYVKLLSQYQKVDVSNNNPGNIPKYYSQYKFVLIMGDNLSMNNIIDAINAYSIPIYWGTYDIFKYINKNRIICILDFETDEELLEHIKYLNTNEEAYRAIIEQNVFIDSEFNKNDIMNNFTNNLKSALSN